VAGGSGATPRARFHGPGRVRAGRVVAGGRGRRGPSGAGSRPAGAGADGGDGAVAGPEACPLRLGAGMEAGLGVAMAVIDRMVRQLVASEAPLDRSRLPEPARRLARTEAPPAGTEQDSEEGRA